MKYQRDHEHFPASAGPWLDVYFDNAGAAKRFATGVRKVLGYRATVDSSDPEKVTTNAERWQISELMVKQNTRSRNAPLRVRAHGEQGDCIGGHTHENMGRRMRMRDASRRSRLTRSQQAYVHRKIRILRREHPRWSQKQVVAVAYSYARRRVR